MTHVDQVPHHDQQPASAPEVEALLLKATHDLAATLGVEPEQALQALATVVQRRADFERLRGAAKAISARLSR